MNWLANSFFNPGLLTVGGALIAVPVIIHLINRLRFRRVRFAAMEFLLQSQQRNRRRILLEQLLLLLMRMGIVAALVLLIARLIIDPEQMSIFRGAKAHHVILLDDSGSMRERNLETSAFGEAKDVITRLVAEGARRPETQKLTLVTVSRPDAPLFTQRDVNEAFVSELETKLENLEATHQAGDITRALEAIGQLFEDDKAAAKHLHVISDFRRTDWIEQKAVPAGIRSLSEQEVAMNLVRVVAEPRGNLAVTTLTSSVPTAAVGVPVRFRVGVQNLGNQVVRDVRLSVTSDGRKLPLSLRFDQIEPQQEAFRDFDATFDTPKRHKLAVALDGDVLPEDNARYLAIDVQDRNRVLIVDGNPTGEDWFYLDTALSPDATTTGLQPLVGDVDVLRREPLDRFQCIYLLNVAELPPDALFAVSEYVAAGGGLAWFLGDAINPSFYNDKLYAEGKGLFPVQLGAAPRRLVPDETDVRPDLEVTPHPIFSVFQGQDNPLIETVRVNEYFPLADERTGETPRGLKTIASLRNGSPFMLQHQFGKGRVITCLSSAGPLPTSNGEDWNNWARNPSYVVTQLELQKYIAIRSANELGRETGEPIVVALDPADYVDTVEVVAPDVLAERVTRLKAAPVQPADGEPTGDQAGADADSTKTTPGEAKSTSLLSARFADTDQPGVYTVRLTDHSQLTHEELIAYNFPLVESSLLLATTPDLRRQIGQDVRVQIQEAGNLQWIQGQEAGQEIRNLLLLVLFALLLGEQFLAYKMSYHPKTVSAHA